VRKRGGLGDGRRQAPAEREGEGGGDGVWGLRGAEDGQDAQVLAYERREAVAQAGQPGALSGE